MRKLFALVMILGLLACGLGVYSSQTFTSSDYYRALNPVCKTVTGHDIDQAMIKEMLTTHISGSLPGVGSFSLSLNDLMEKEVEIPGYGTVSMSSLLGTNMDFFQKLWAQVVIAGYAWSHELILYGGIAAGLMLFLLIGTHRPKRRH